MVSLLLLLATSALPFLGQSQASSNNADLFSRHGPSDFLQQQAELSGRDLSGGSFSKNTTSCAGYNVSQIDETWTGLQVKLSLIGQGCQAFGYDYQNLLVDVEYQTEERLRVHIYDADQVEFQVPESVFPKPTSSLTSDAQNSSDLVFNHVASPFAFYITRRSSPDAAPIFDTRSSSITPVTDPLSPAYGGVDKKNSSSTTDDGKLIAEAGFFQIGSALPEGANIYGLGEVVSTSGFRRNETGTVQTMWARDVGDPEDQNMYGSHPVYLETRFDGNVSTSHGVFLLSSQGMDILLRPGVIEYRALGGSFDFFFTSGPTPLAVIEQHYQMVGKPSLYPAWSFGFHLCRWGYDNVTQTREVVTKMREAGIPLETMWNDIDFMDTYRNWIPAPGRFDPAEYTAFVNELHAAHQHYIMIIDAAVSITTNSSDVYEPYTSGLAVDAFIKNSDLTEYVGKVWPGYTVFPDWFNNGTTAWWTEAFLNFSKIVPFDGVWLDMNEPSSFCDGSCGSLPGVDLNNITTPFPLPGTPENVVQFDGTYPEGYNATLWGTSGNITVNGSLTYGSTPPALARRDAHYLERRVGKGVDLNTPAYEIHNALDRLSLSTVSPNATHAEGSIIDLDVHNLWGIMEEQATYAMGLEYRPNTRPFLISRSTFPGSGKVTGHWLGDNYSTWKYMKYSIAHALQFQLFGIPLVGADICGFNSNTDEELCNRWMQLGAFFPFMRNHNTRSALSQEPFRWDSVANASRTALNIRYSLFPHWYTLLANATNSAIPPMQALFFQFPNDQTLLGNSEQFFVGSSLLVTPVLTPNVTSVTGQLPGGDAEVWRDFYTHEVIKASSNGTYTFPAPLGHLPLTLRGGNTFLLHSEPGYTIYDTQQSPYSLLVSLSISGEAYGTAYLDDGEAWPVESSRTVNFGATASKVYGWTTGNYTVPQLLETITVLGVASQPSKITLNGGDVFSTSTYTAETQKLVVTGFKGDLNGGWQLDWS